MYQRKVFRCGLGGSSSTYPYIHITINTLQVELKNAWGATDLRNMKCVCSSAGITNTCHTTEESQAIVVTPPTGSLGFIRMLLLVNGAAPELPTVRVRVGGGMGHLRTENTQVIPPPAFYCINRNQPRPLQSGE